MSTTPQEAVSRALSLVGKGIYQLGCGDYKIGKSDVPWTDRKSKVTGQRIVGPFCDCWGFIAWCYRQPRHHPGYNKGGSVEDDINTDAAIEDARGINGNPPRCELWSIATVDVLPGDLLVWPSIRNRPNVLPARLRIGHVGIVVDSSSYISGDYSTLTVVQCGSNGIRKTSGRSWNGKNMSNWGVSEKYASVVLRSVR